LSHRLRQRGQRHLERGAGRGYHRAPLPDRRDGRRPRRAAAASPRARAVKRPPAPTVRVLAQVLLVLNAATVLGPLAVALFSAFKTTREIFRAPFLPPATLDLANFVTVWRAGRFDLYLRNS